ncbi:hypothetical protein GXW82_33430 [Streptacidiphilus sp. 4-A2]|nr:hypothetical protein [Streptacidiphilus sp. 4-A2]
MIQSDGEHSAGASAGAGTAQATVPDCVLTAVARPGQQPIAVSSGSYQSTDVYALIYPDGSDPAHDVDAYLVAADCTAPAGHASAVLVDRTVPRP